LRRPGTPTSIAPVTGNQAVQPQLVDESAGVARMCARATGAGVIALDTESDSLHSYFHKLCLIQISFAGEHVVLDPLVLDRESLRPFADLLGDPKVEKVLHGADYDLRVLNRDLGARVVRLRDTQLAAQLLGEVQTGLAALVEREAGVALDKRHQRADWGKRPLSRDLLAYAAGDTAYLELLRGRLAERLAALGRLPWWEEECEALEAVRWEPPVADPLAFERIRGASKLVGAARDRLAALHAWREQEAASQDVPPFRILHSDALLTLASNPPSDLAALAGVPGVGRRTARLYGSELMGSLTQPPLAPAREARQRVAVDRQREARVRQARAARDTIATQLQLDPGVLAPRTALELVVDRRPRDEQDLLTCLARRWRTSVLAPALLALLAGWEGGAATTHAEPT